MTDSRWRLSEAFRSSTATAISPASPPSAQNAHTMNLSRTSSKATGRSETSRNAALSTTSSVLNIVSEVSKAVADVPYVGAIATIVNSLIKIREELEAKDERCQELLEKVFEKIFVIFNCLRDLEQCEGHGDFKLLEIQMQKYREHVRDTVSKLRKRRLYKRLLDRGTDELDKLDRRVNDLDHNLLLLTVTKVLRETSRDKAQVSTNPQITHGSTITTHFPPAPIRILEREEQHHDIAAELISNPSARVALLGMGGIGKTTLACSIARDPQVVKSYPHRLFLSFEGCSTDDLAYTKIATTFKIPSDQRGSHEEILLHVLSYLGQKRTLFVIDNFETWWEVPGNRRVADDFLGQLASLQELAMVVTLRGIQRPSGIDWFKITPLQTLTQDASMDLLSAITKDEYTGSDSGYVQKLLEGVAGIPLAVTLIGGLLRDGSESPRSLWSQWTRESTRAIGIAGSGDSDDHRLYKLDISLRLSIFGPRMSENTKDVLAAISILPTGLRMDDDDLDELQDRLPNGTHIRDCIRTLQNVALVIIDTSASPNRLRMLSPVRDFCLSNLPLDGEVVRRMIDVYNENLQEHDDWGSSEDYTFVTTELSNFTAIIDHAISLCYVTDDFGQVIYEYISWKRYLCILETDVVERAIAVLSEHPQAKAQCLGSLGDMLSALNRDREAVQPLEQALSIHRQLGLKDLVGWDLYCLGDTHIRLGDYSKAEDCLNEAKDLVIEIDDKRKQGEVLHKLAEVYLGQDKLPQAECTVEEALELVRDSGNRQGEVVALSVLGRVYRAQGKYDLAIEKLKASRDASKVTHNTHSEALANENLGYAYCDAGQADQAGMHFQLAASIYRQIQLHDRAEECRTALEELGMSLDTSE